MGLLCARQAEFTELHCSLTPEQTAQYDAATELWQVHLLQSEPLASDVWFMASQGVLPMPVPSWAPSDTERLGMKGW